MTVPCPTEAGEYHRDGEPGSGPGEDEHGILTGGWEAASPRVVKEAGRDPPPVDDGEAPAS